MSSAIKTLVLIGRDKGEEQVWFFLEKLWAFFLFWAWLAGYYLISLSILARWGDGNNYLRQQIQKQN